MTRLRQGYGGQAAGQIGEAFRLIALVEDYNLTLAKRNRRAMKDYPINLFWSDEDGCWVADIPDLKHCSAVGDTPEQAVREIRLAKEAWLEAARAAGRMPPGPQHGL